MSFLFKFVTKRSSHKPCEEPIQTKEQWTQVDTIDFHEATAPSEKVLTTIPEEVIETTFTLYPKLKT